MSERALRSNAIVVASAARVVARVFAMQAANDARASHGYAQAYPEEMFLAVIDEEGIGWNTVIELFHE